MTKLVTTSDGNTPLSSEELADLIPSLATKEELNEWDARTFCRRERGLSKIARAPVISLLMNTSESCTKGCSIKRGSGPVSIDAPRRTSEVPVHEFRERFMALYRDVRYWIENNTYSPDEIAVRFPP